MYALESIDLLQASGIQFHRMEADGIDPATFAEFMLTSGLVLNEEMKWISFHRYFFLQNFQYDCGFVYVLILLFQCLRFRIHVQASDGSQDSSRWGRVFHGFEIAISLRLWCEGYYNDGDYKRFHSWFTNIIKTFISFSILVLDEKLPQFERRVAGGSGWPTSWADRSISPSRVGLPSDGNGFLQVARGMWTCEVNLFMQKVVKWFCVPFLPGLLWERNWWWALQRKTVRP